MIDNKKVKDSHQKGIERVKGIGKTIPKAQGGRMGEKKEKAHWKREGGSLTPRRA